MVHILLHKRCSHEGVVEWILHNTTSRDDDELPWQHIHDELPWLLQQERHRHQHNKHKPNKRAEANCCGSRVCDCIILSFHTETLSLLSWSSCRIVPNKTAARNNEEKKSNRSMISHRLLRCSSWRTSRFPPRHGLLLFSCFTGCIYPDCGSL